MSTPDLHSLAMELDANGLGGHDSALVAVARTARSAGLSPTLVDVLGDPDAPEIARLRAFGRIAALLATPGRAAAVPTTRLAA